MHLYIFGSLPRGEVGFGSDVDLLAITEKFDPRFDPDAFSIYSYKRICELWKEGNPFAWHLATEAKLIFASDNRNYLSEIGPPTNYHRCAEDCLKFARLYAQAIRALKDGENSRIFELSTVFLAVRNFATCFSLGKTKNANFSRHSAKNLGEHSLKISEASYSLLERSRILSTRAVGLSIRQEEVDACLEEICGIASWMNQLLTEIPTDGRI
jgi:hypothetical protein